MTDTKKYTIQDYIAWRGDIPFAASAFNDVDAAILCQISYLNFDGLLEERSFKQALTLGELAQRFQAADDLKNRLEMGVLINEATAPLLFEAGRSRRFSDIKVTGYVSIIDFGKEEQFSALTYLLGDKTIFLSYRGTDDTIVGWKEDFNLAVSDELPAQRDALAYIGKAARALRGKIRVGGHSKGGNLAVYAAAMATPSVQRRIVSVHNFDGPGFPEEKATSAPFTAICGKIRTFCPQHSIVGMLFCRVGSCTVVESAGSGILQHDLFTWCTLGNDFIQMERLDPSSEFFGATVNAWISALSIEKRKLLIDTVFDIIAATNARTNSEIEKNIPENLVRIVKAYRKLDPEVRRAAFAIVRELFRLIHRQLPDFLHAMRKGRSEA